MSRSYQYITDVDRYLHLKGGDYPALGELKRELGLELINSNWLKCWYVYASPRKLSQEEMDVLCLRAV